MAEETPKIRTIAVGTIARVEGEGALRVTVKDGSVQDVELQIFEPPRFFEAFLQGRHYNEVPDIVARICGIWPTSYSCNYFEQSSILFADVVNFTSMSATMAPEELLELLNEVFSTFHKLVEKHGLEKIKTIGDCYMVASGVPVKRNDHAEAITEMALEMRDYAIHNEFKGKKLHFRIGINSGPVIAGVIGQKKFSYDLWGDPVNTASRMEPHGEADTVQISQSTYDLIKDKFNCVSRGVAQVKGKGEMRIWAVENKKNTGCIRPGGRGGWRRWRKAGRW